MWPVFRHLAAALTVLGCATLASVAQEAPLLLIGGEDGTGAELGRVVDVAVLPQLIVVLESDAPHLHVFDTAGRHIQAMGRRGGGPGEFRAPMSVTYDSVGRRLLVMDPANSRLTAYAVGDTLALAQTLSTTVAALVDICVLGERLYGLARSGSGLVRELELRGGVVRERRAFGGHQTTHALRNHPMLRSYVARGTLWCDRQSETVFVSSAILGEVHILSIRSGEHRTYPVKGFVPMHIEATGGTGLRFSVPTNGRYERLLRITADAQGPLLNVAEVGPDDVHRRYFTVRLSSNGAQSVRANHQWQQIGVRKSTVICSRHDPYPTVAVFRGSQCP